MDLISLHLRLIVSAQFSVKFAASRISKFCMYVIIKLNLSILASASLDIPVRVSDLRQSMDLAASLRIREFFSNSNPAANDIVSASLALLSGLKTILFRFRDEKYRPRKITVGAFASESEFLTTVPPPDM
jgi:hypothetical protein